MTSKLPLKYSLKTLELILFYFVLTLMLPGDPLHLSEDFEDCKDIEQC